MDKLQEVQERLAQLDPNNRDHLAEIQGLKAQEAELRSQQEREQAIEEKVETADVPFSVAGNALQGMPPAIVNFVEKIVKVDRKRIYNEVAVDIQQIEDEYSAYKAQAELRIDNQDNALESLRQDYEACARELKEQTAESIRLMDERDDYKQKLANASIQLDEKDAEIARLNDQIDEYQKAKVWGERQQQQIIDIDADSDEEIQAAAEEVKKLYTAIEDWGSVQKVYKPDGTFDLVKRSELEQWAPIDLPLVEPVLPFQGEAAPTQPSDNPVPAAEATAEVGNQFQTETGLEMAVQTPGVEETVSRQEFETLKNDVEALKRKVGWAA